MARESEAAATSPPGHEVTRRCRFDASEDPQGALATGTDREGALTVERIQRHRSSSTRGARGSTITVVTVVILAASLSLATARDRDRAVAGAVAHTGLIVASNVYLFATPFDSPAALVEAMKRLQQPQIIGACCGGAWRVHFAALLERPSGEDTLNLAFDDVSTSGGSEQRIRVFSSAIPVGPGEATVFVNDFVISKDQGFIAGHQYEVSLWPPAGADRKVLARGRFTLN
jgi:hypothetical protein